MMFRILGFFFLICVSNTVQATNFWLSTNGDASAGAGPPTSPAMIPTIFRPIGTSSGSIFVWARPDSGKTLGNWSLRLISTNPDVLSFSGSVIVENYNPLLGNTGAPGNKPIVRWEHVAEPIGNNSSINDIQGFSIAGVDRVGIGIGPQSTNDDPFYDSLNDAWLLAQIDYNLIGSVFDQTDLFLQIGEQGLNNFGSEPDTLLEDSELTDAIFGATTDLPLNANTQRMMDSETADARITIVEAAANFDDDNDIDGADYLAWQRGFGKPSPKFTDGDANGDGVVNGSDLAIWVEQYGNPSAPSILQVVPESSSLLLGLIGTLMAFVLSREERV